MRTKLQHRLNSRHIFCRLVELGVSTARAYRICIRYERIVHPLIYGRKHYA